ncbi:PAS domain S-box protein [Halorubrum aquaticum]|uniref:hybrid sensor histidine kinase/response regulator n=1 Tax=Halorubrum aquaticum TaxID=387340 RepID=UPI0031DBB5E2
MPFHEKLGEIRILHVDDDPSLTDLAATFLQRENDRFTVETASSASEGLDRLNEKPFDCVVSDYDMPEQNGINFLKAVRETHPNLPFILFTGKGSEEIASKAISAGVTDYLQKGRSTSQYTVLANRITNVVEQFQSRQAITETEQKLSQLAEHTDDILFMFNDDWSELLFINSAYEDIWGGSIEELRDDPESFVEYIHPDDRENAVAAIERIARGESIDIEYRVRHPDGEQRWIKGKTKPIFDEDGAVSRIVGYVRDITDRKEWEQELKRKERRYQAVFNDPNILVGSIDTDGTVRDINQTALKYIDATVDDVIGEPFWESPWFDHSETVVEEVKDWIDRAAAGEYVEFEVELVRPDGEPYTVEGVFRPVTNEDGEVVSLLISDRDITEQKQRETELETVQRRFEAVLENTTTPMFMKDDDGAYIFVNQAYRDLFDLQDVEIVGRTDHEIHPPEMAADVQENDQVVIEGGEAVEREERVSINNEERVFLSTKVPIHDTGKRFDPDTPVATFGVATDITDRKEAEQQLREEQQFVQSIFQSLPDPLYAFDTDGHLLRWNEMFEDVTGYSSAEIEDMHVTDFVPDTEVETISAKFQAILDEDQPVTIESAFETKDRTRIPYEFTGGPLEATDGTTRGITGIGRDITERTAREHQLEALNRITQELMSADTQDEVVEIGVETMRDLLGIEVNSIHLYDEDADALVPVVATDAVYDLIGEPPTFSGEDSIAWRVYQQGETLAVDIVHENPDRYNPDTSIRSELFLPLGEYGILLAGSPSPKTFDEQDVLMGEILAGGLTTALEQIEGTEQIRTRERELTRQNNQLEEFASIVSHDLRNPLNVATGRLELAAAECDSEHLEHVEQAHERMHTLIEDILALAREGVAVADSEPVALGPLVEGCWETVETGETRLVANITQTVQADRSRLKQVFENLMRNAIEHGGEDVTVTVGELADGFYIEDDGSGIPADERETIFDAGYSTSEDGTGFGLSIIKQIVDAHDWDIHVTDSDEGGARFEIAGVEVVAE